MAESLLDGRGCLLFTDFPDLAGVFLLRIVFQRTLLWQPIVIVSAYNQILSLKCDDLSFETVQFKNTSVFVKIKTTTDFWMSTNARRCLVTLDDAP